MTKYIYKISLLFLILCVTQNVWGQLSANGGALTSGTYTLNKNVTITSAFSVSSGNDVIIDLKTFSITRSGSGFIFSVAEGGKLTLKGTGTISGGRGDRGGCAHVGGTLILDGPTISDCISVDSNYGDPEDGIHVTTQGCGGAVYIQQRGSFEMRSGKIINCKTDKTNDATYGRGGAVFIDAESDADPGTFKMSGGTIENCSASYGGAVYVHQSLADGNKVNGIFEMSGGTIQNNTSIKGGGVYVCGSTTLSGGNISGNKSVSSGPGIYVQGALSMSNGSISNNSPKNLTAWSVPSGNELPATNSTSDGCYGGGVYIQGESDSKIATFEMTGGKIENNVAASGGGVMVWTNSEFKMNGVNAVINSNYAIGSGGLGNGGAVYVQSGTFNLLNGKLTSNRAVRYGGAVNTNQSATFNISGNTEIYGNIANYGGGFSQEQGACTMSLDGSGIQIKNNIAKNNGGGIMIEKGRLSVKNATISNNTAGERGGGVSFYVSRIHGDVLVDIEESSIISQNSAGVCGGGIDIYVNPGASADADKDEHSLDGGKNNINSVVVNLKKGELNSNTSIDGSGINIYINTNPISTGAVTITNTATVNLGTVTTTPLISGNTATNNGGGIAMNSGTFNIANATFSLNSATNNGGGMYLGNGNFTISGQADLTSNSAKNGGGIYVGNGTFTVSDGGSINAATNNVTNDGGAIYLAGGNIASTGSTSLKDNYSGNFGGAIYVSGGNVSLKAPLVEGNGKQGGTVKTKKGGAIYLIGSGKSFTATGESTIRNNASTIAGGAVYVEGGNINMAKTTLSGNNSKDGGAAYVQNGGFTTTGTTSITNNYATTNGGAVYVSGGTVSLNTPDINSNTASNDGGAIYSSGTVTFNGESSINSNEGKNGGAIYTTGDVLLKGNSTMENNVATADGGVIYVDGGNISSLNSGSDYFSVTANNNSAVNGGAFRVNGSIALGYTLLNNNTASENGGAVALYNGTFSMKNDDGAGNKSTISHNTASNYGGGLYIMNSGGSKVDITWNGGVFTNNKAKAGGAVSADGNIALTFAATMENNQAEIGGGLYINNGVDMEFGSGLVRGNSATQPTSNTTVYATSAGKDASNVSGVGGGIFMAKNSKLTFTNANELGIYNNFASNAGADICSNGDGTTITLPNVTNMQLTGFDVPGNKLYWMEDYFTNEQYDSNVVSGIIKGVRYEDILKNITTYDLDKYKIEFAETYKSFTNYICLDLGYDLVYVNFTVEGLDKGDVVAIICNYPKDDDYVQYRKVLFVGNGTSQPVTKQISLPSGYWSFAASDWSYNYSAPSIFRADETTAHTGNIFISRKDSDKDANGNDVAGFRVVKAKFETKTPPAGSTEPNKYNVKQSQSVKVNRMGKNVTNN